MAAHAGCQAGRGRVKRWRHLWPDEHARPPGNPCDPAGGVTARGLLHPRGMAARVLRSLLLRAALAAVLLLAASLATRRPPSDEAGVALAAVALPVPSAASRGALAGALLLSV